MDKSLIIIVSYNSQDFISRCLASVVSQSFGGGHMAVIDNNSSDGTVRQVRDFRNSSTKISPENFSFLRLKKNLGYSGAINYFVFKRLAGRGHDFSRIIFLNPDLYLKEDALENLLMPLGQNKRIGACGGLVLDYDSDTIQHLGGLISPNFITSHIGKGKNYDELKEEYKHKPDNILEAVRNVDYVTGAMLATDFSLFKKIGGFDTGYRPAYYEELDYCLKLKAAGYRVVVNPLCLARHAEASSSRKFSHQFYKLYHKNRIRCAVINSKVSHYFKLLVDEINWARKEATRDQYVPLAYSYMLNFIFAPLNLGKKLKNYLILNKLQLK